MKLDLRDGQLKQALKRTSEHHSTSKDTFQMRFDKARLNGLVPLFMNMSDFAAWEREQELEG